MPELRVLLDVDELLLQLRHPLQAERLAAARALDDVAQTPEIERALRTAAFDDPNPDVRRWSLHALGCAHCKPDGVCSTDVVGAFVHALLHDRSRKVRRFAAGCTMWSQLSQDDRLTSAFRTVLATSDDRVLRERAATYLAALELPRGDRPYREWLAEWEPRREALLAS